MTAFPYSIGADAEDTPGLAKAIEEVGELQQVLGRLQQVLGKALAVGGLHSHYDGSDLKARFIEEAGDVLAALEYMASANAMGVEVEGRKLDKLLTFHDWHKLARDPAAPSAPACSRCEDGALWPDGDGDICPQCGVDRIPF